MNITERFEKDLQEFTGHMRYKLIKNTHKGHWENLDLDELKTRLIAEVSELFHAIRHEPPEDMIFEAADVANYAMMIAWVARHRMQK